MSAHTPGPWRVTGPNVRAGDALVAIVTNHWADEPTPDDEKASTARLIAAAPELLAALSAMLGAAELDALDDTSNVWRSLMLDAHAAIQRANGAI